VIATRNRSSLWISRKWSIMLVERFRRWALIIASSSSGQFSGRSRSSTPFSGLHLPRAQRTAFGIAGDPVPRGLLAQLRYRFMRRTA
jgi:hypothetical protein